MFWVLGSVNTMSLAARRSGNGAGALGHLAALVYPQPSSTVLRPPRPLTQNAKDRHCGRWGPWMQCRLLAITASFGVC